MTKRKRMLIIIKPTNQKKNQKIITWLLANCQQRAIQYQVFTTTGMFNDDLGALKALALLDCKVVVVGGDGTLHLAVNAFAQTGCVLALLPLGTGNDFARGFAVKEAAWRHAVFSDCTQAIDIGKVNDRYFINVAGVGFDAHVVESLKQRRMYGALIYSWQSLKLLFAYKSQSIEGSFAEQDYHYDNLITVFANHKYFGGGLNIAPQADLQDGLLDCYAMHSRGWLGNMASFVNLLLKSHHSINELLYTRLAKADIRTAGLKIEADGELIGQTPAVFCIVERGLLFNIPIK